MWRHLQLSTGFPAHIIGSRHRAMRVLLACALALFILTKLQDFRALMSPQNAESDDFDAETRPVVWRAPPPTGVPVTRKDLNLTVEELVNVLELVENDVVLCLSASSDKVDMLVRVLASWDGPAVVAIFSKDEEMAKRALASTAQLVRGGWNTALVHAMAHSPENFYPVNAMRNFAIKTVPIDKGFGVFVLDSDMIVSRGAYKYLRHLHAQNTNEKRAFVVPCFEFGENSYDLTADVTKIPRTKSELLVTTRANLTRQSKLTYYPRGHSCTEYERWLYGSDTEPWQQSTYHWQYEPFVLVKRSSQFPLFDDKYLFWGGNKQSHIWLMFAMGYRFWTVPNVFSVHYPHVSITPRRTANSTAELAEKEQLTRNRARWAEMRLEIARMFNVDPDQYDFRHVGLPTFTNTPR
eukprot:Opistho-1_new@47781